jgi:hypothetical protein
MDFKIDMSKVVKIVVEKDENSFIEYTIDNGTIKDVAITSRKTSIEDKVNDLKQNNEDVKKISKLIEFDNAGILDQMARSGKESVFETIKESITNEPIQPAVVEEIKEAAKDVKVEKAASDAKKIMKLEKKMDEVAKKNRDKIADKIFPKTEWEKPNEKGSFDEALKINDRGQRIAYLKKMITNLNDTTNK